MEEARGQAQPGGGGLYLRPASARSKKLRHDLEGLWIVYQAKLLDALDLDRWVEIFETTVSNLLSSQPLQSLTKRARLGVVMSIVGSGRTHLHTPVVLAVLATDWSDEWASFKLLQDTVRQASLYRLKSEWGFSVPPELHVSRTRMADLVCLGVEKTVASWRALGIGGSARDAVEKAGRELRGLAARCRGAGDRSVARKLLTSYLASHRVERFTQALIAWGQEQLGASQPTIFDQAFPFLGVRQIQASRSRADARRSRVPKETRDPTFSERPSSPAAYGPSFDVMGTVDTHAETSPWGEGKEPEKNEGSRKRRKTGALLHLDERVIVRKKGAYGESDLWRRGAIETCRGDGTYDVRYDDDGEVGHMVRRQDILGREESDVPTGMGVGMLTRPTSASRSHSPLKRPHIISRASADKVAPLPPCSPVSEEHTTAGSTSPLTTTDGVGDSWCVTHVDDDSDEGNYTSLIQRRSRKRRVLPDDECGENDSTTAASDAAAAVRVRQASLSGFSDDDEVGSQPQSLCIDQARGDAAVGSQAGQERTTKKEGKNEGGSCDGFRHREPESELAHKGKLTYDDVEGGAEGVDGEEDETDEELAEDVGGTTQEEDITTDEEVETSTSDRTDGRCRPQEENGEANADEVCEDVDNREDDAIGFSPPQVNETPSDNVQQVEPNGQRASTQHLEHEENEISSVGEGEGTQGAGAVQGDFAPPSLVPRVPPTIQGTTDTCGGQDTCSHDRNEASPKDEGTRNGVVDGTVDSQLPGRPTRFMRVYGSAGISRVRESMAAWFSQRQPNL